MFGKEFSVFHAELILFENNGFNIWLMYVVF
jgi:hypothetical protein